MAAARSVARNPVRAKLVGRAEDGRGSSVRAPLCHRDDGADFKRCGGDFAAPIASESAPALVAAAALGLRPSDYSFRPSLFT
jgi:hypothetical protein